MNRLHISILLLCLFYPSSYTFIWADQQPQSIINTEGELKSADNVIGIRALAGQMCTKGSYVIGFDKVANIICTEACGNGVLNSGESCDDGNTEVGDGCSATCQSEKVDTKLAEVKSIVKPILVRPVVAASGIVSSVAELSITDVGPASVLYGTRELTINVSGTGFQEQSVIIFDGSTYDTSVNKAGTQLEVTLTIGDLSIGAYAVTVSNGSGMATTLKKALEIY